MAGTGGTAGAAGTGGMAGTGGTAGMAGAGGTDGMAGTGGTAGMDSGSAMGTCCDDGDCLCHGPEPSGLTSSAGPFEVADYRISTGTVYYPTDAEPPFAGVALCGGFLNTGPEMAAWGPFYASHGIVTVIVDTLLNDSPSVRATKLLAAVDELDGENTAGGSPLQGKLAGRYGTSGYSMGGGGTVQASVQNPDLMTSVGLAAWTSGTNGSSVQVPTLLLCGSSDTTAPCRQSAGVYSQIPSSTPKMQVTISGATHFSWFGPTDAGRGQSGEAALAFQKVFLEGDERWRPILTSVSSTDTNIQ
jgi:dienelactone hydrolase